MLSTGYTRISCTVCWVISVEYLDVFSSKVSSQNGSSRAKGCPIYRVLVSRDTLILMTSSFWWHMSHFLWEFSKSAGISRRRRYKGAFFPLEGQFLPGH